MSLQLADALLMPCKCYSAYILIQFICVHECSCNICTGGSLVESHVESIFLWLHAHMYMFRIAINKLFERLFSRVLASHREGLGSFVQDMPVLGPLV
jgi:hypothetical protein